MPRKQKSGKGFLSEKELKSLEEVPLPANLSIVRDVFIFAVYTGLSYVDIENLTNENINVGIDKKACGLATIGKKRTYTQYCLYYNLPLIY